MDKRERGRAVLEDMPFREKLKISFRDMLSRFVKEEAALIMQVYDYAEKAHRNAKRIEGPLFWTHPVGAAKNYLRAGGKDHIVVCGILLHDVAEDTNKTADLNLPYNVRREETRKVLSAKFGSQVADIVDALTKPKIKDVDPQTREERDRRANELLQFSDWRGLEAKASERLHNVQTLTKIKPENQLRTIRETWELIELFKRGARVSPEPEVMLKLISNLQNALAKAEESLTEKGYGSVIESMHAKLQESGIS